MSYKMDLTDLQNVVPGNTATLKLPVGPGSPTYDLIRLELGGGLLPSHLTFIRGKIGGRIFLDEGTGTEVQTRDSFRGIFTEPTFVNLDFTEPKSRNGAAEQLVSALPGSLASSILFEIGISGSAPGGSTLKASCDFRPPTNNPYVMKRFSLPQGFPAAGTEGAPNILYLPKGNEGGKVKRIWLKETTAGNVQAAEIRIANNTVFRASRAKIENGQKRNGLVPVAGMLVLDFIEDGNLASLLDTSTAPTCELRLVTTAGEQVKAYIEYLDPIDRL